MSRIKELREQQARIATNARAKFDEITDETPEDRAGEIEREFDAMMAEHDQIGQKIERLSKLEEAEARANAGDPRRPSGEDAEARAADNRQKPEYKEVFSKALRFGVGTLDVEERDVLREGRADLSPEERAQSVGTDSAGGYTVPTDFSGEIDRAMAMWGPMWDANIVREISTSNGRPWTTPLTPGGSRRKMPRSMTTTTTM